MKFHLFSVFVFVTAVAINVIPNTASKLNVELNSNWESFKVLYGKKYEGVSELSRRLIWEQNIEYIQKHNIEYDLGKHTYYLGVNEFADMSNDEYRAKYLSSFTRPKHNGTIRFLPPLNYEFPPIAVDWRTKGYVTPVKNQAQCGSCWAFSTTGSVEGQHFRETGKLLSLSEQQLVDCSSKDGNMGCNGGLMDNAFKYIEKYGLEAENSYPYTASDSQCNYDKSKVVASVKGFIDIKSGNEKDLAVATASVGPISVAIDASHISFQLYKGGVYNEAVCSSTALDHGVLIVGYGVYSGNNYWLVKNSWGPTWGLQGYIMMSKDNDNQCGIATQASYPLV